MGIAAFATAFFIGGGSIRCSRPTGLSGCVTAPTSSCPEFSKASNVGRPISPVPRKTMRKPLEAILSMVGMDRWAVHHFGVAPYHSIVSANLLQPHRGRGTSCSPGHRSIHEFFASGDLTTPSGRATSRAEIIEDLEVRKDQKKPFPHWHRGFTFVAVKTGGGETVKLLLVHTRRSRSSRYRAEPWRAAVWRQPPRPALCDKD